MRPRPAAGWLLALLSATLQVLCFPSPGIYVLCWIALAPLFVILIDRRYSPTLLHCVLFAYVNGIVWYAGSCFWIYHVMHYYGSLSPATAVGVLILFCFYLALYHALFGLLLGLVTRSKPFANARALIVAPVLWVAVEFARAHVTSFPWDLLGYSQIENLPLTRLATYTGVYGLSWVIALVNAAFALGFLLPRNRRMTVGLVAVLGAIALEWGVLVPYPPTHTDHVAELVQVNLPILETDWAPAYYDHTIAELVQLSDQSANSQPAQGSSPKLIVWPESPAPFYTSDPRFRHWMSALAQDSHAYVIAGSLGVSASSDPKNPLVYNSAQLVAPDGNFAARYDKIHLVPFGEYVPFRNWLGFAQSLTHDIGDLSRGNARNTMELRAAPRTAPPATAGGTDRAAPAAPAGEAPPTTVPPAVAGGAADVYRVGTFICYESIFPDEVRQFAANGAQLFVNISDDGWYGEFGAPGQHLNMARMRAIENGRWLLRATNNGVTASISPLGQVVAQIPRNTRAVLEAPYAFESGTTFYTRHGDWFAWLCAIISILTLILAAIRGRAFSPRQQ